MNIFKFLVLIFATASGDLLECMKEHCTAQAAACGRAVKCGEGIKCIENGEVPVTENCAKNCIESNMDLAMISLGACASSHGCMGTLKS